MVERCEAHGKLKNYCVSCMREAHMIWNKNKVVLPVWVWIITSALSFFAFLFGLGVYIMAVYIQAGCPT